MTNRPTGQKKNCQIFVFSGDSDATRASTEEGRRGRWQCRAEARTWALPDAVHATKKSFTSVASGTTAEKGAADKDKPTTNRNLAQGKESNAVRTATSYFDPVWNAFSKHTDGSMQWIPRQIVAIGEDFHSQVGDGKVRTTLYKVRWEGYDKKDDTWEPITHLQGYATMVKSFKESHAKDLEKLAADRQCQAEKKVTEDLVNAPKHTVLSMAGLTSAVWTLGMFQMVSGESCQCIQGTKQTEPCHVGVRHAACTVPKCGFVIRYQNTSNLEQHYIRGGDDHKELAGRLAATQRLDRGVQLGAAADICTLLDPRFKNYKWWLTRKYVQNAPVMHSVYIVL